MIGQYLLLDQIDKTLEKSWPRFSIIVGQSGSGKKLVVKHIASKTKYIHVPCGIKIDEIREVINLSYKQNMSTLYSFLDCDTMSIPAKNSLLKVIEEPPRNSYFVMTISDLSKTLPTIKSRGSVFYMQPYSKKELKDYLGTLDYKGKDSERIISTCDVPGQINEILTYDLNEFFDYVQRSVEDLMDVPLYNSFKVASKLRTYGDNGWDILIFLKAVQYYCLNQYKTTKDLRYYRYIQICLYYINQLQITGINKQFLVDSWITAMHNN